MTNEMMKLGYGALSSIASIKVKDYNWSRYSAFNGMDRTIDTVEKFVTAAGLLPEGSYLGLQLSADSEGKMTEYVFSTKEAAVAKDDFTWIFGDWAEVSFLPDGNWELCSDEWKVYALKFDKGYGQDKQEKAEDWKNCGINMYNECKCIIDNLQNYFLGLKKMLSETGAVMRVVAGHSDDGGFGYIFINLPTYISLHARAAMAMAFPGSSLVDAGRSTTPEEYRLSSFVLKETLSCLMQVFSFSKESSGENPGCGQEDEDFLDDECYDDDCYDMDDLFEDESDAYDSSDGLGRDKNPNDKSYSDKGLSDGTSDIGSKRDAEDSAHNTDDSSHNTATGNSQIDPSMSIDELELSVRAYNCLRRAGINTIGDLLKMSADDLLRVRNLGRKTTEEVKNRLAEIAPMLEHYHIEPEISSIDRLNALIGLYEVKEQVRKIAAFSKLKKDLPKGVEIPIALNMQFVGNPGTAKTTVARIMAGILYENGLLKFRDVVEVGRSDLVAKYVGQTAIKVKEVFQRADGKLLFIDEAYSLVENWEGEFGDEAINTIVQEMENRRDRVVVVFAGYPDKMEEFFQRNPGLKSRVPFKISFKDYSAEELLKITELEAAKRGFSISQAANEKVTGMFEKVIGDPNMGNGRFCRNAVESAILSYATRKYGEGAQNVENDFILIADDFEVALVADSAKPSIQLGFRA